MPDLKQKPMNDGIMKKRALSRWENEGGAPIGGHSTFLMKTLPPNVIAYKKTPLFTNKTVPPGLLHDHRTKAGTWGLIQVQSGALQYTIQGKETHVLTPGSPGVVEPGITHCVTPLGEVIFFVEFYREEVPGLRN